jgi:hypothetical protein
MSHGSPALANRCGTLPRASVLQDCAEEVFVLPRPIPEPRSRAGELCRQYLLLKYREKRSLAQAFIAEIDRSSSGLDDSQWRAFINAHDGGDEILKPLDRAFQQWLQT